MNKKNRVFRAKVAIFVILAIFVISSIRCGCVPGTSEICETSTLGTSNLGTIYYVDSTNGNDDNNGLSLSNAWKTIAKVNASTFNPGDFIVFKKGEIWREQLTVPSSGAPGNPITFGAYGEGDRPIIKGSDILKTWVKESDSVYSKSGITTEPQIVFFDGTKLTENDGATTSVFANEWDWDSGVLYVNVGENPDYHPLEAGQRDYAIQIPNGDWTSYNDLQLLHANRYGMWTRVNFSDSNDIIISNNIRNQ